MTYAEHLTDLIGKTPLIKLGRLSEETGNLVLAKAEFMNPGSSIKDRAAYYMITNAEKQGAISSGSIIVEPSGGNTGIALALVCSVKGYRLILTMPDSTCPERQKLLKAMGAEVVLTPAAAGSGGAIRKAEEIAASLSGSYIPMQFSNSSNPESHYQTTGPEIWADTDGKIDWFVAASGTGGTLTGCSTYLKKNRETIKIAAVEPWESSVISGEPAGDHRIHGTGPGFIPENLHRSLLDRVIRVRTEDAEIMARKLVESEGLFTGVSSAANVCAAAIISEHEKNKGLVIVTILCDSGERYLSAGIFD